MKRKQVLQTRFDKKEKESLPTIRKGKIAQIRLDDPDEKLTPDEVIEQRKMISQKNKAENVLKELKKLIDKCK